MAKMATQENLKKKCVAERSRMTLSLRACSTQQSLSLALRVTLGCRPAREHESDLVHEVCDVVDHVEEDLIHSSKQVAKQIAKRVDTPANCDNQTHGAEGACHSRAAARCGAAGLTIEDLE